MLDLIISARDGSRSALDTLLAHYRPLLLSVARREIPKTLAGKVAPSSIVQQTCIDAMQDIQKLRAQTEGECKAWLTEILRMNIADASRRYLYTEKRDVGREVPLSAGGSHPILLQLVSSGLSPDAVAIAREEGERLNAALSRLPEDVRQAIEWRFRDRVSYAEIGLRLGKEADAVRIKLARDVKALAKEMLRDRTRQ